MFFVSNFKPTVYFMSKNSNICLDASSALYSKCSKPSKAIGPIGLPVDLIRVSFDLIRMLINPSRDRCFDQSAKQPDSGAC